MHAYCRYIIRSAESKRPRRPFFSSRAQCEFGAEAGAVPSRSNGAILALQSHENRMMQYCFIIVVDFFSDAVDSITSYFLLPVNQMLSLYQHIGCQPASIIIQIMECVKVLTNEALWKLY